MAIRDRLRRLEGTYDSERCEEQPCMEFVTVEVVRHPDGSEETIGGPFPPLCKRCPLHEGRGPWRHIKVVRPFVKPY